MKALCSTFVIQAGRMLLDRSPKPPPRLDLEPAQVRSTKQKEHRQDLFPGKMRHALTRQTARSRGQSAAGHAGGRAGALLDIHTWPIHGGFQ